MTREAEANWLMLKKNLNTPVKVKILFHLSWVEMDVWIPELIPALSCPASEKPQGHGACRDWAFHFSRSQTSCISLWVVYIPSDTLVKSTERP